LTLETDISDTSGLDLAYGNNHRQTGSLFALGITSPTVGANLNGSNAAQGPRSTPLAGPDEGESSRIISMELQSTSLRDRGPLKLLHSKHLTLKDWEYSQDFAPRIIWPPKDLEDDRCFDPENVMPTIQSSIDSLTRTVVIEPVFQEMLNFCAPS
jgi:hypothetical protein